MKKGTERRKVEEMKEGPCEGVGVGEGGPGRGSGGT